jgi:protein dithiol oxidoreductase (disulfide-forming)
MAVLKGSGSGLAGLLLCLAQGLALPAYSQPVEYQLGVHYQELANPLPDLDPDRYEVLELFWYGCPACFELLPTMQLWEASYRTTDMNFTRLPVAWNSAMETHARAYMTADRLGMVPLLPKSSWEVTPTLHNGLFEAVQVQGNPLRTPDEIFPVFEGWGVAREDFDREWNAEQTLSQVAAVKALPALAEIASLPALVIHGRYVLTFNEAVTTSEDLFKVLSMLVVQIREEQRTAVRDSN